MNNCYILSSTASTAVNSASTGFLITPDNTLAPTNEQGIKILITTETTATGASLPVTITLGGADVLVYDKYGNIVYGNQLYKGLVLKGYYGNNGYGNTAHFQLIKLPIRYCYCGER